MSPSNYQKTSESFVNYLKAKSHTSSTIYSLTGILDLYYKWLDKENLEADQITYTDLLLFMKYSSQRGISQRTIQMYISSIKSFYEHLIQEGKVTTNPATDIEVKGVKRKTLYHIFQPHELHTLYNQYETENLHEKRNKILLGLLIYQGLKMEELIKLKVNDVKLREGQIDVPGGRRSNGRVLKLESHQVLDMYDYVLQTRLKILEQSKRSTDQLLVSTGGSPKLRNLTSTIMKSLKKTNPNVQNAKQIRASVITKWLKTHNLREVQYWAGHRYISSTESYQQNDITGLQEEINQFHPLG